MAEKVNVYVRPTNYNRLKAGTHTISQILNLEGYKVDKDLVEIDEQKLFSINCVRLIPSIQRKNRGA